MERETYLIVGLGNPGREYARNRHNVGFHCLTRLAQAHDLAFGRRKKRARIAEGTIAGQRVMLAMPQTFMNESGRAVGPLTHFYKVELGRLLVIYDDLDLPPGTVRIRPSGGSGGHKGMRSIIQHLGSQEFARLRVGIGRPPGRMDPADYVLQDLNTDEEEMFEDSLDRAVATIQTWLIEGVEEAMSRHNQPPPEIR